MEAFATLLLMAYAIFLGLTYMFRNTLLPPPMAGMDTEQGLPPAQNFGASDGTYAGSTGFTDASIGNANPPGVL